MVSRAQVQILTLAVARFCTAHPRKDRSFFLALNTAGEAPTVVGFDSCLRGHEFVGYCRCQGYFLPSWPATYVRQSQGRLFYSTGERVFLVALV